MSMIKSLLMMTVTELEEYALSRYAQFGAHSIHLADGLDNAIYIPARTREEPIALLVAHTDTVFNRPLLAHEIAQRGPVIYSKHKRIGLGADDRAGVYACMRLYDALDNVAVLLCPNEETGCQGSRKIQAAHLGADADRIGYALQFDRRGSRDIVSYDVADSSLVDMLESNLIGYAHAQGSYSDIVELCPTLGVQGCNISIGYDNEHTPHEILDVSDMHRTIDLVRLMLQSEPVERFPLDAWADEDDAVGWWSDAWADYVSSDYDVLE